MVRRNDFPESESNSWAAFGIRAIDWMGRAFDLRELISLVGFSSLLVSVYSWVVTSLAPNVPLVTKVFFGCGLFCFSIVGFGALVRKIRGPLPLPRPQIVKHIHERPGGTTDVMLQLMDPYSERSIERRRHRLAIARKEAKNHLRLYIQRGMGIDKPSRNLNEVRGWRDAVAHMLSVTHAEGFDKEFLRFADTKLAIAEAQKRLGQEGPTFDEAFEECVAWLQNRLDCFHEDDLNPDYDGGDIEP